MTPAAWNGSPIARSADGAPAPPPMPGANSVDRATGDAPLGTQTVVVLLVDLAPGSRWYGWLRLVRGPGALRGVPGLRFAKVLGSGRDGGFGLQPSASRQGLFLLFDDEASADAFVAASPLVAAYRRRAVEFCVAKLRAFSCRGQWSGQSLQPSIGKPSSGAPLAALTRASIRPSRAAAFWRRAAPSQDALAQAPGCRLAVGLGEAPLLRQATFSLWDSVAAMDAYARSGAHLEAIRASQREGYFSESMFVRFVPLSVRGTWKGVHLG